MNQQDFEEQHNEVDRQAGVDQYPVSGINLRFVVVAVLIESGRTMTMRELVAAVEGRGFLLPAKRSKAVSDAIRWEVRKGRAVRIGWGLYRVGTIPRSTSWWIRKRALEYEDFYRARWGPEAEAA